MNKSFTKTDVALLVVAVVGLSSAIAIASGASYIVVSALTFCVVLSIVSVVVVSYNFLECKIVEIGDSVQTIGTNVIDTSVSMVAARLSGEDEESEVDTIIGELKSHKIGVATALYDACHAPDWATLGKEMVKVGSMIGVEEKASTMISEAMTNVTLANIRSNLTREAQFDFGNHRRLIGITGMIATSLGMEVTGKDPLKFLFHAKKNSEALEKFWGEIEGYMNEIGIIKSGKFAILADVQEEMVAMQKEFDYWNTVLANRPALVCKPSEYRRWSKFKKDIMLLDAKLSKITDSELKGTRLMASCASVIGKVMTWAAQVEQVRLTNGVRPVPVGICIHGKTQLGKSTLFQEIRKRVGDKLYAKYESNNVQWHAFCEAKDWQVWSVQARDEYDQGYGGQEITYMDDGFADKENKDHLMWLSFISGQAIGTVQASLDNKGMPYQSRLCFVSCNQLPSGSTKINNIEALQERFPVTINVSLKRGKRKKKPSDPYDPEFEHLNLHVGKMTNHCCGHGGGCGGSPLTKGAGCRSEDQTLDQVCDDIVKRVCDYEMKFQTQLAALSLPGLAPIHEAQVDMENVRAEAPLGSSILGDQLIELITEAAARPAIRNLYDPRVISWAQYLRRRDDGRSFLQYTRDTGMDDPFELLISLGAWEVPENQKEQFDLALERDIRGATRFFHSALETMYIWGPRVNANRLMIAVPLSEGVDSEEYVSLFRNIRRNSGRLAGELNPAETEELQRSRMWLIVRTSFDVLQITFFPVTCWGIGHAQESQETGVPPLWNTPGMNPIRRIRDWRYGWWRDLDNWHDLSLAPISLTFAAYGYLCEKLAIVSNAIVRGFVRILEWIGIPVSRIVQSVMRFVTNFSLSALIVVLLPFVVGVGYATLKQIIKGQPEEEERHTFVCTDEKTEEKDDQSGEVRRPTRTRVPRMARNHSMELYKKNGDNQYLIDCPKREADYTKASWLWWKSKNGYIVRDELYRSAIIDTELSEWLVQVEDLMDHIETDGYLKDSESYSIRFGYGPMVTEHAEGLYEVREGKLPDSLMSREPGRVSRGFKRMTMPREFNNIRAVVLWIEGERGSDALENGLEAIFDLFTDLHVVDYLVLVQKDGPRERWEFALLSTVTVGGAVEIVSRRWIQTNLDKIEKATNPEIATIEEVKENLKRNVQEEKIAVRKNLRGETVEQSADDAAILLHSNLVEKHTVCVTRGRPLEGDDSDYSEFDDSDFAFCAGLAFGNELICPAHMGKTGEILKTRYLGKNPLSSVREQFWGSNYTAYEIVYHDDRRDIAYGRVLSKEETNNLVSKKLGVETKLRRVSHPREYSTALERHIMSEEQLLKVLDGVQSILWCPTVGSNVSCLSRYEGNQEIRYSNVERGKKVIRDWIEVTGIQGSGSLNQKGDCGGLLMAMNPRLNRKVLGFHVAGSDRFSNSAMITTEWLEKARKNNIEAQLGIFDGVNPLLHDKGGSGHLQIDEWPRITFVDKVGDDFLALVEDKRGADLPKGNEVISIGQLKLHNEPANLHKGLSTWMRSQFFGIFDIRMEPAPLDYLDPRIEVELPKNGNGTPSLLMGPNSEMGSSLPKLDGDLLKRCVDQMIEEYKLTFSDYNPGLGSIDDSIEDALNGRINWRYMTGMEVNTSPGMPWTSMGYRKKNELIEVDDEGKRVFTKDGESLKALVKKKIFFAQAGARTTSFCTSKLKNTQIKCDHVKIGKTRVFNCSPVEEVIVANAVFSSFKECYIKKFLEMRHAIGVDPHSIQWDQIYRYLNYFPNWLDIDFRNYDKHLHSLVMRYAYLLIISVMEGKCEPKWIMAAYTVAESDVNTVMLDCRTVYSTEHGNKSGCAMTTIINCIVNDIQMFYCFSKIVGTVDLGLFRENVKYVVFGDDIAMTVSNAMKKLFNFFTLQEELQAMGHEVTSARKEGPEKDFTDKREVTFLKRRFKDLYGHAVGPLEQRSIEATFGWTEVEKERIDVWREIVKVQLEEAALWGENYYKDFRDKIINRVKERYFYQPLREELRSILSLDYKNVITRYFEKYIGT